MTMKRSEMLKKIYDSLESEVFDNPDFNGNVVDFILNKAEELGMQFPETKESVKIPPSVTMYETTIGLKNETK